MMDIHAKIAGTIKDIDLPWSTEEAKLVINYKVDPELMRKKDVSWFLEIGAFVRDPFGSIMPSNKETYHAIISEALAKEADEATEDAEDNADSEDLTGEDNGEGKDETISNVVTDAPAGDSEDASEENEDGKTDSEEASDGEENEDGEEEVIEASDLTIEQKRAAYEKVMGEPVPNNMKNNEKWMLKKMDEKRAADEAK